MALCVELYKPGENETHTVAAAQTVTGKRLLEQTADFTVQHAGANSIKVVGVARVDSTAGELVEVISGGTVPLVASGVITAGAPIVAAANGFASVAAAVTTPTAADVTATRAIIGHARTAAADGQEFFCKLTEL